MVREQHGHQVRGRHRGRRMPGPRGRGGAHTVDPQLLSEFAHPIRVAHAVTIESRFEPRWSAISSSEGLDELLHALVFDRLHDLVVVDAGLREPLEQAPGLVQPALQPAGRHFAVILEGSSVAGGSVLTVSGRSAPRYTSCRGTRVFRDWAPTGTLHACALAGDPPTAGPPKNFSKGSYASFALAIASWPAQVVAARRPRPTSRGSASVSTCARLKKLATGRNLALGRRRSRRGGARGLFT